MKYLFNKADHEFFSGKKFLGFVNENNDNEPIESSPDVDIHNSDKVDSVEKNTKERIKSLLKKAEGNQKVIDDLRAQLEAEEAKESSSEKNPEILEDNNENSEITENLVETENSSSSGDEVGLSDHNSAREHGSIEKRNDGEINEEEERISRENSITRGNFDAYKSQEKNVLDVYSKHNQNLDEYLYGINDLRKSNEILGAASKNIRQFKGESTLLNELRFRSMGLFENTKNKISNFANKFDEFQKRFKQLSSEPNDQVWHEQNTLLIREILDHVSSWKRSLSSLSISEEILGTKNDLKRLVYDLVPDKRSAEKFTQKYFEELDLAENTLSKTLDNFLELLQERDFDLSGMEKFWDSLPKAILKINQYIDFNDGVLKDDMVKSEDRLNLQQDGLNFLQENNFFEEGEHAFSQKISAMQGDIKDSIKSYSGKFNKVRVKVYKDIDKLDDDDFFDKYSFDKEKIIENIEAHAKQIELFENEIESWGDGDFMDEWLEKYNHSDESRAQALVELGHLQQYKDGIGEIKDFDKGVEQFLNTSTMVKTYNFSLYDMYQVFKRYFEKRQRLWERRSERAVANLGVDVFGADTPVGKEFTKEAEDEEHKRVDEFETQKSSLYGWDVQKDLYKTNDADEAKACINLLIKNGFMKWDDPEFWKTLNRLEGINRFIPGQDIKYATPVIINKVKEACTNIWSANDFNGWQTSLKSSVVSAQDNFEGEFESYEAMDSGARTRILSSMLQKWNSTPRQYEGVDPAKFEAFIRFAFTQGKMNGGPAGDQRWWFLVHGVASGLLSRDAFSRLNGEFLGGSPLIDFFTDSGWKKDGKPVPEGTPGAEARQWEYEDFQIWARVLGDADGMFDPGQAKNPEASAKKREIFLYDYVYESTWATDRVGRMVRNGAKNFDHDDAKLYTAVFNATDVGSLIGTESQAGEKLTKDFWRNYIEEFENYFQNQYRKIREGDRSFSENDPLWAQQRAGILQDVGYRLRTGYGTVQTLLGNHRMTEGLARGRFTIFSKEDWEKSTPFSENANKSKDKILNMMDLVLNNSKISSADNSQYNSFSSKTLITAPDDEFKKVDSFNRELVKGGLGDKVINGDPDAVFKALEQFCGGSSPAKIIPLNPNVDQSEDSGNMAA